MSGYQNTTQTSTTPIDMLTRDRGKKPATGDRVRGVGRGWRKETGKEMEGAKEKGRTR